MRIIALLAIAAYFGISILATIHPEWFEFVQGVPGRDKLVHFLGAGLMSTLMIIGFSTIMVRNRSYGALAVLGAVALLVTLEELGQLALPSRTFDLGDLGWSYLGIAVFGLPAKFFRQMHESAFRRSVALRRTPNDR